jgi:hypothetical protein
MATEKRIFTLTLIVLLSVFLSFNTVLPCWILGQQEEGFQEGKRGGMPNVGQLSGIPGMDKTKVEVALDDVVKNKPQCFNSNTGQFDRKCVLEGDAKTLVSHTKLGNVAVDEIQKRYNIMIAKAKPQGTNVTSANVAKAPGPQPKVTK